MPRHYHPEITDIHPNIMSTKNSSTKKVRISNTSYMFPVENLSLRDDASNLWYTKEETDIFKAWLGHNKFITPAHIWRRTVLSSMKNSLLSMLLLY